MAIFTAAAAIGVSVAGAIGGGALITGVAGTLGTIGFAAIGFATQAAIGFALNALAPKPKAPNLSGIGSGSNSNRGYTVNQRGSALDHQIVYGRMRVGGAIVFNSVTGNNNKFLHQVVAYTGHEIESFDEIYINDAKVTNLESNGNVKTVQLPDGSSSNRYDGFVRINKHLGSSNQSADSDLISRVPEWTNSHRLRGIAYLYIRLKFDQDVFPNGVPQVTTTIKGKKVYDPRTDTTAWSDNPALCLRDYIASGYGLSEDNANIDDDLVSSAANICDETDTNAGTKRYTCNGAFTTDNTPYDAINDILTSMGGLVWYAQGEWRMKPAYWTAPTVTFDEDDLRSSISVKTRHSRRDNFNIVRGTFRGEESDWQITDYPEVSNQDFIDADNGQESVADLELPFTDNSIEARRIARIALERNRQQLTVSASFGLRGFQVQVGDVVNLSIERFGWTNKSFEVTSWTFGLTDAQDLQVQMTLREITESVFDEVDDGVVYERDNTTLLSPFEAPPVGISVSNDVEIVYEHARNVITVDVTSDSDLIDRVEVQHKETGEADWKPVGVGDIGPYRIVDLEDGNYDIRARSINSFGVKGDWKTRLNFPAKGLAPPPEQVQNFSAEVNGASVLLGWDAVGDPDLSYYRVRYSPESSGVTWRQGIDYVNKVAKPATSVYVPARAGTYMIKAVDQGGRESEDFTSIVIDTNDLEQFTTTLTQTEDPTFSGTKTNVSVTDSNLRLDSTETEGEYVFSDYIDIGSTKRARVRVDTYQERFTINNTFDLLGGNIDNLPGLWDDLTANPDFGDTNVIAYVSTTNDDPAGTPTWSDYKVVRVADINARAFRFKVKLTSPEAGVTPSISELDAVVQHN